MALDDVRHLRHLFGRKVHSLASIDIKDGYHHFKLCESVQHLFAWHIQGKFFQSTTLNYGWNQSPHFFVKLLGVFLTIIRAPLSVAPDFAYSRLLADFDYKLLVHMDDVLVVSYMPHTRTTALLALLTDLFDTFGICINARKLVLTPA